MIYRAVSKEGFSEDLQLPLSTNRVPSNIPYLVDNLWECLRYQGMPSRRTAVFASPKRDLAMQYANDNSVLSRVEIEGRALIAQITDYPDARFHPDVKALPRIVMKHLGQDWVDSPLSDKGLMGGLFFPALAGVEVSEILSSSAEGQAIREEITRVSTFWHDVKMVKELSSLTDGELFFYAPNGYRLIQEEK